MDRFIVKPKQKLMNEVVNDIKNCQRCSLWRKAKNPVPGGGSLEADLMLIGEAPGYWEDIKGHPFVGQAGKLLDELLKSIDLERREVYIGNIIKHRPPDNRDPNKDEIEACSPFLERQISIIKPKMIVTLGRHSTRHIFSQIQMDFKGIFQVRGQIYKERLFKAPIRVVPTLHPAAALYNPNYKQFLEVDFSKIKKELRKSSEKNI